MGVFGMASGANYARICRLDGESLASIDAPASEAPWRPLKNFDDYLVAVVFEGDKSYAN